MRRISEGDWGSPRRALIPRITEPTFDYLNEVLINSDDNGTALLNTNLLGICSFDNVRKFDLESLLVKVGQPLISGGRLDTGRVRRLSLGQREINPNIALGLVLAKYTLLAITTQHARKDNLFRNIVDDGIPEEIFEDYRVGQAALDLASVNSNRLNREKLNHVLEPYMNALRNTELPLELARQASDTTLDLSGVEDRDETLLSVVNVDEFARDRAELGLKMAAFVLLLINLSSVGNDLERRAILGI